MVRYTDAMHFAKPIPVHALRPEAELAREAVRRHGRARRLKAEVDKIVTDVGRPARRPYDKDPVPANARKLEELAKARGFETQMIEQPDRCTLEGIDRVRRIAFRAYWVRGATKGGTWHEPYRYEYVNDPRAVKIDKTDRVGLKGYRAVGVGRVHLSMVASPKGIPLNVTQLTERIDQHGD